MGGVETLSFVFGWCRIIIAGTETALSPVYVCGVETSLSCVCMHDVDTSLSCVQVVVWTQ